MLAHQLRMRCMYRIYSARASQCSRPTPRLVRWASATVAKRSEELRELGGVKILNLDDIPTVVSVNDPDKNRFKLVQAVENRLSKDEFDEAAALARLASSQDPKMTVVWNYLIDYALAKERLNTAMKLFSEMKRRGQLPNAQTYTTIFRGCSKSKHTRLAVAESVRLYTTLLNDVRLEANTIHLNAVLNVCAKAGDIDAMMSMAATADGKLRKANAITYNTILNGLRSWLISRETQLKHDLERTGYSPEAHQEVLTHTLEQAKRIWQEVMSDWEAGAVAIDEDLVCTMCRLLLKGTKEDWLTILPVLHETMGLPLDLDKRKGAERKRLPSSAFSSSPEKMSGPKCEDTAQPTLAAEKTVEEQAAEKQDVTEQEAKVEVEAEEEQEQEQEDGAASTQAKPVAPRSPSYDLLFNNAEKAFLRPQPTVNTLSLVLQTCQMTRQVKLGLKYWDYFQTKYKVVPDRANWHAVLCLLKRGHSSGQVVQFLRDMPELYLARDMFDIALETCLRDSVNPKSLCNADVILDMMIKVVKVPSVNSLKWYLDLATNSHLQFRRRIKDGEDPSTVKPEYGNQVAHALNRLMEPALFPTMRAYMTETLANPTENIALSKTKLKHNRAGEPIQLTLPQARNYAMDVLALSRKIVAAYDRIVTEKLLPEARLRFLADSRNALNKFIVETMTHLPAESTKRKPPTGATLAKFVSQKKKKKARKLEKLRKEDPAYRPSFLDLGEKLKEN